MVCRVERMLIEFSLSPSRGPKVRPVWGYKDQRALQQDLGDRTGWNYHLIQHLLLRIHPETERSLNQVPRSLILSRCETKGCLPLKPWDWFLVLCVGMGQGRHKWTQKPTPPRVGGIWLRIIKYGWNAPFPVSLNTCPQQLKSNKEEGSLSAGRKEWESFHVALLLITDTRTLRAAHGATATNPSICHCHFPSAWHCSGNCMCKAELPASNFDKGTAVQGCWKLKHAHVSSDVPQQES